MSPAITAELIKMLIYMVDLRWPKKPYVSWMSTSGKSIFQPRAVTKWHFGHTDEWTVQKRWTGWVAILGMTHVGPRNNVLHRGQDRMNQFASMRGDKSSVWPFVKILWPLWWCQTSVSAWWVKWPSVELIAGFVSWLSLLSTVAFQEWPIISKVIYCEWRET